MALRQQAGLSGFMWLKNPSKKKWNSLIKSEQLAKEIPDKETGNLPSGVTPQLTDGSWWY